MNESTQRTQLLAYSKKKGKVVILNNIDELDKMADVLENHLGLFYSLRELDYNEAKLTQKLSELKDSSGQTASGELNYVTINNISNEECLALIHNTSMPNRKTKAKEIT